MILNRQDMINLVQKNIQSIIRGLKPLNLYNDVNPLKYQLNLKLLPFQVKQNHWIPIWIAHILSSLRSPLISSSESEVVPFRDISSFQQPHYCRPIERGTIKIGKFVLPLLGVSRSRKALRGCYGTTQGRWFPKHTITTSRPAQHIN